MECVIKRFNGVSYSPITHGHEEDMSFDPYDNDRDLYSYYSLLSLFFLDSIKFIQVKYGSLRHKGYLFSATEHASLRHKS